MATVLNKYDIVTKICQFYDSESLEDGRKVESSPLLVTKLVAVNLDYGISVGGGWIGSYLDDDYAIDVEMTALFKGDIYESFAIAPTNASIEHDSIGVTLEWIPSKPLVIKSKIDYVALYKSFSDYLEDISGDAFKETNFKICFYPLYLSEVDLAPDDDFSDKLFSEEYFQSTDLTVQTPGAIFYFDKLVTSEKS